MTGVYVEISVFKPTGFAMRFFVEDCENRWSAILQSVEKFNELNGRAIEFVNYIEAKLASTETKSLNPSWITISNAAHDSEPTVQKE